MSFSPCDVVSCSSRSVYWSLSTIGVCMVGIEEEEGDAELLVAVGDSGFDMYCDQVCLVTVCVVRMVEDLGMGFICLGRSVRLMFGRVNLLEVICGFGCPRTLSVYGKLLLASHVGYA